MLLLNLHVNILFSVVFRGLSAKIECLFQISDEVVSDHVFIILDLSFRHLIIIWFLLLITVYLLFIDINCVEIDYMIWL